MNTISFRSATIARLLPLHLTLMAMSLSAASITVLNPSFETATLPSSSAIGTFNNLLTGSGTLANWTATGASSNSAGAFAPNNSSFNWGNNVWWSGSNVAYLVDQGPSTNSLSQTLSATLANDTIYTLSALIGRNFFQGTPNYSLQLFAGSTLLASASNLALASGTSGTDSLVFSSGANNALAGQLLQIVLTSTGVNQGTTQAYFDNVSLDGTTTGSSAPEPGTWVLTAAGLLVIGRRCSWRVRGRS